MCVFPGGGVDPRDFDPSVAWAGPDAGRVGGPARHRRARRRGRWSAPRCARRSRSPACCWPAPPTTVVADTTGDDWEADRVALEGRELSFTDFLDRRGLVLRTDLLGAWAGWLTPVFEPRRYRTWFFVALLPEGQVTRDVSTESSSVTWLPGDAAVAAVDGGRHVHAAADLPDLPRGRAVRRPGRGAGGGGGADGRDVHARGGDRPDDDFVLSMPDRYVELVAAGDLRELERAARSASVASACWPPTRT